MQREFLKNLIFNNLSQGMQFGSRWIFNLVLISLLSDTEFGIFAYVLALANILMGIFPFGSATFLLGEVNSEDKLGQLGRTISLILVLFVLTLLIYVLLLPFQIEHYGLLIFGVLLGLVYSLNLILFFYLKSIGEFKEEIRSSAVLLILTVLVLLYFFYGKEVLSIPEIFTYAILLNVVVVIVTLLSKHIPTSSLWQEIRGSLKIPLKLLHERLYYGLQELMTTSFTQISLFIMFYFLTADVYGDFRKIFIVIAPILLFVVTFSQVLLHHLKNVEDQNIILEFRRYFKLMFLLALAVMLGMWFFRSFLLTVLGKLEITQNILNAFLVIILAVGIKFLFVNYEMLLVRLKKQHLRFWVMFTAMIVNFLTLVTLTPLFGLMGAVLVDLSTNFTILVGLAIVGEKQLRKFSIEVPEKDF